MKYFTKYLPVEGEPKPGDYVDDPELKEIVQIVEILEGGVTEGTKVVKLFLCSRDIQVGDKARSIVKPEEEFEVSHVQMGSGKNYFPAEMLVWNKLDNQVSLWRTLTNTFKVIGPISPQAVWVKEGDEFEGDDIYRYGYSYGREERWTETSDQWDGWVSADSVKIKCPVCGTFH